MTMYFNNEDTCRQAIVETRWGVGENQDIVCPYCGQHHCATRKDGRFRCNKCKRNFSCRAGTIFNALFALYYFMFRETNINKYRGLLIMYEAKTEFEIDNAKILSMVKMEDGKYYYQFE